MAKSPPLNSPTSERRRKQRERKARSRAGLKEAKTKQTERKERRKAYETARKRNKRAAAANAKKLEAEDTVSGIDFDDLTEEGLAALKSSFNAKTKANLSFIVSVLQFPPLAPNFAEHSNSYF